MNNWMSDDQIRSLLEQYLFYKFVRLVAGLPKQKAGICSRSPATLWWLQNHQTTVPNHVFSPDGVVRRVFSPFLTT